MVVTRMVVTRWPGPCGRRTAACTCSSISSACRLISRRISTLLNPPVADARRSGACRVRLAAVTSLATLLLLMLAMCVFVAEIDLGRFGHVVMKRTRAGGHNGSISILSSVLRPSGDEVRSTTTTTDRVGRTASNSVVEDNQMDSTWQNSSKNYSRASSGQIDRHASDYSRENLSTVATAVEERSTRCNGSSNNFNNCSRVAVVQTISSSSRLVGDIDNSTERVLPEVVRRAESVRRHCRWLNESERRHTNFTFAALNPLQRQPSTSSPSHSMFFRNLLVDHRHSIVYCDVPKVASSTVKAALAVATGRLSADVIADPSESRLRRLLVHSPKFMSSIGLRSLANPRLRQRIRRTTSRLGTGGGGGNSATLQTALAAETEIDRIIEFFDSRRYRKFVIVRNPFDRVVSAYRDKFTRRNRWTNHFHRKYGRFIVSRYRDYRNRSSIRSARWQQYWTSTPDAGDVDKRNYSTPSLVSETPRSVDNETDNAGHDVTFVEFVRFLIDEAPEVQTIKINPHWQPVTQLCRPCTVNYDYVVRIESFQPEMTAVWNELLLPSTSATTASGRLVLEKRRNSGPNFDLINNDNQPVKVKPDLENDAETVTSRYTRLLSRDQLCRLAAFYREDFELFGYKFSTNCLYE